MDKFIDVVQYVLFVAALVLALFINWKLGLVILAIDMIIGFARKKWTNEQTETIE